MALIRQFLLPVIVLLSLLHCSVGQAAVSLSLGGTNLTNNSVVVITDIGIGLDGLICTTTFRPCCRYNKQGEWYYPNGTMVSGFSAGENFYRSRSNEGEVRLNRRYNAMSPTGIFYCELPDSDGVNKTLYVGIVYTNIISTGINTVGEQYTLTCSSSVDILSFQWLGQDGMIVTTTDSLMITSTPFTSILQFNPLQSSHEGNYTCLVTVQGTVVERRSIQVNVEEPVITAMISGGSPTVGESYSLTCTVTGADKLNLTITYLWFKDNTVISGETQSTLSISSLRVSDAGQYRCNVTVSSYLLSQSITAMSNTLDLTLPIPPPTAVTVTASPDDPFIVVNHPLNLTCSIELNEYVDIPVTVNTMWSGPSDGTQFTTITSVATMRTTTIYASTAMISSVVTSDSGEYTCEAIVSSISIYLIKSNEVLGARNITVKDTLQMFQLKLGRTDDCATWNDDKALKYQSSIHDKLLQEITSRCQCKIPQDNLLPGSFSCHDSHNQTTYRSTIIGTQSYNATQLVEFIQDWVTSEPTLTIQWYTVKLDTNCPVSISSLGDPECGGSKNENDPDIARCVEVCIARRRP